MTVTFTDLQKKYFGLVTASERGVLPLDSLIGWGGWQIFWNFHWHALQLIYCLEFLVGNFL